jgi:acyl-coenzyme A synthetase/AMP-(fatty) acid ligase
MSQQTIGHLVLSTAKRNPDLLAIVGDKTMLNYSQLGRMIGSFAARMKAEGIGPGTVVALESGDLNIVAPTVLACSLIGASWIWSGNAHLLADDAGRVIHFTDDSSKPTSDAIAIDQSWVAADPLEFDVTVAFGLDDPFIYAPTSGTTGKPKLLCLSQNQQMRRAFAAMDDFVERETVFCTLFSPHAYPYVSRFLSGFVNGATVIQSRDIALWDAAGMNHFYGSVSQIAEFLGKRGLPRKFPMVHISGSKVSDGLARHLLNNFELVVDLYASTETNRSFKNIKFIDENGDVASRGVPLDSTLQIVNEHGQTEPDGTIGYVRVQNGYLATGYLNNAAATATSFRDGWFYTGDLGMFGANGALQIIGRTGDVLNLGGLKVNALEMDQHLRALPGVDDAMCFDLPVADGPNTFLAFVVPKQGVALESIVTAFGKDVVSVFGAKRTPSHLIEIGEVPRAHDGGAMRFQCQEIYTRRRGL